MNWIAEFKNAYNLLEDKLYLADGNGYQVKISNGDPDYENTDLISLKCEIDKNIKNFTIEDYKYWTKRIYRQLGIKEVI